MNELIWVQNARAKIGTTEIKGEKHNADILKMWEVAYKAKGQAVPTPFKNDETAWCGGFMGYVFAVSDLAHHIPNHFPMARSWLSVGTPLDKPAYGCVAIFWRGSKGGQYGHVGLVVGKDKQGRLMILGGNQSDQVNIMALDVGRVLGYRWLGKHALPHNDRYNLPVLVSNSKVSTNEA